jgi:DNA-binding transcriptional regulator/RsmH inhibitor MraZ
MLATLRPKSIRRYFLLKIMLQAKTYKTMLDQGSVKIPSALWRLLRGADHLFIAPHVLTRERGLLLFTPGEWKKFETDLCNRRPWDRTEQLLVNFYLGGVHKVPVDRQGRIQIPERLQRFFPNPVITLLYGVDLQLLMSLSM